MKSTCLIAVILCFGVTAKAQTSQAPSLDLKDIRGRSVRLADFKGKVVLLNFWATWCVPCRTEIPDLVKKQSQYQDQGLQIIGITYPPQKLNNIRRFTKQLKMNYPVVIGTRETKRMFTSSEALPTTVVIDRAGVVRDVIEGIIYEDEFEQKVLTLLSQPASDTSQQKMPTPKWERTIRCFAHQRNMTPVNPAQFLCG